MVFDVIFRAISAPVQFVVNVAEGKNVLESARTMAVTVVTAPVAITTAVVSEVTAPIPALSNAIKGAGSVAESIVAAPINVAAQSVSSVGGMIEDIAQGENVFHSIGKGVAGGMLAGPSEAVRVIRSAIDEGDAIFSGKESQRRKCKNLEFGPRVLIYDNSNSGSTKIPDALWQYGGSMVQAGRFTHVIKAQNWPQVWRDLAGIRLQGQRISEIQFWGHGSSGSAYVGTDCFNSDSIRECDAFHHFVQTNPFKQNGTALIWFRTCCTLTDEDFARKLSAQFDGGQQVRIAGHTVVIAHPNPAKHDGLRLYDPSSNSFKSCGDILTTDISPDSLHPIFVP